MYKYITIPKAVPHLIAPNLPLPLPCLCLAFRYTTVLVLWAYHAIISWYLSLHTSVLALPTSPLPLPPSPPFLLFPLPPFPPPHCSVSNRQAKYLITPHRQSKGTISGHAMSSYPPCLNISSGSGHNSRDRTCTCTKAVRCRKRFLPAREYYPIVTVTSIRP